MKPLPFFFLFFMLSSQAFAELQIIEFDAKWCEPCKSLESKIVADPEFCSIFKKYRGFVKIDIDKFPSLKEKYKVTTIPHYIVVNVSETDGKISTDVVARWSPPEADPLISLKNFLKNHLTK